MNKLPERPQKDSLRVQFTLAAVFSVLILGWLNWDAYNDYHWTKTQLPRISEMQEVATEIARLDKALTVSAQMAVVSDNPDWETRHRRLEPQLDWNIKRALQLGKNIPYGKAAAEINAANIPIMAMESRAFELLHNGNKTEAQQLLSGEVYQALEENYASGMMELNRQLFLIRDSVNSDSLADRRQDLITIISTSVMFSLGACLLFGITRRWQTTIRESNQRLTLRTAELAESNNHLDRKVGERTKELNESALATMNMMEDTVRQRENAEQAYINLKREETKLAAHALELTRSNEELERFAHAASHDLQEPLRSIQSFTQLLTHELKGKGNAQTDEYAAYISKAVHRMKEIIDGVMEYSQVSRQQKSGKTIDLKSAYQDAVAGLDSAIKESSAVVTCGLLPSLQVDAYLFRTLFHNLIANALKFRGMATPVIDIKSQRIGSDWTFFVQDNGIGIPPEYRERVFGMFQRLHTREQYPGSGLGLAMCKRIVERHGGRIWIEQVPHGSRFVFTIPAEQKLAA